MSEPSRDIVTHMRDQLVKRLVMRDIFCVASGEVLDIRTCVVLVDRDGDPKFVLSQKGWTMQGPSVREWLAKQGVTVDESTVRS